MESTVRALRQMSKVTKAYSNLRLFATGGFAIAAIVFGVLGETALMIACVICANVWIVADHLVYGISAKMSEIEMHGKFVQLKIMELGEKRIREMSNDEMRKKIKDITDELEG